MVLGFLLARAGVRVTVLEEHATFLSDFLFPFARSAKALYRFLLRCGAAMSASRAESGVRQQADPR